MQVSAHHITSLSSRKLTAHLTEGACEQQSLFTS